MSKQEDIAISVKNVSKAFKLPHEKQSSIKGMFVNMFRGKRTYERQQVLKDVSFDVKKGEFLGIVGRNGSGKSTLLKLMAGIYTPDKGRIQINGKLTPFIELGVGFNPELTGRENVFLNGALLGFGRKEMEAMYDDIVEFAELEKFMDQQLKNYSSGMQVRLAFSIAIRANTDILVLDEVLAVGDEAFQRKCFQYFAELKRNKKTVILVTHSMDHVQQFCDRAILIDKKHEVAEGKPMRIAEIYRELNMPQEPIKTKGVYNKDNTLLKISSKKSADFIDFIIDIVPGADMNDASVAFVMSKDSGEMVYRWVLDEHVEGRIDLESKKRLRINLSLLDIFPDGTYSIRIAVRRRDKSKDYLLVENALTLEVISNDRSRAGYWKPTEKFSITGIPSE